MFIALNKQENINAESIILMESVQERLISNQLPYPEFYNGDTWNTITYKSRKSVPIYLRSELPTMKYQKVKAKFQQMNRFCPPQITYFQKFFKNCKTSRPKTIKSYRQKLNIKKKISEEVQHLRDELQYALIMTSRNSKVLVNVVEKVTKAQQKLNNFANKHSRLTKQPKQSQSFTQKIIKGKRSQSVQIGKRTEKCFQDTVDIIFQLRKKQCLERLKEGSTPSISQNIKSRVDSIRLRTFQTE